MPELVENLLRESRRQDKEAIIARLFRDFPNLENEIHSLGLKYDTGPYDGIDFFEEGKYRHIFWYPGESGSEYYKPYYVYIPPTRYSFYNGWNRNIFSFAGTFQVKGTSEEDRKTMLYDVTPNEDCLGGQDRTYYPPRNTLGDIIENYWASGFNAEMDLTQFHENIFCYKEKRLNGLTNAPDVPYEFISYELFEKWESLSPEEVMLCAQLQYSEMKEHML